MVDRRRAPRKRTHQSGEVILPSQTVRCEIEDVSATGARLVFAFARVIPLRFKLRFDKDGHEEQVQMIWRKGAVVGVSFVQPIAMRAAENRPATAP
jgi:hypothetical protein